MLRLSGLFFLFFAFLIGAEPEALYLTWVDDPTTTMAVVWFGEEGKVLYRIEGEKEWSSQEGEKHKARYLSQLEGLKEGSTYLFKLEGSQATYKFRTLPKILSREVRFTVGGDVFYYWGNQTFQRMNHAVAHDDPDFVVLGGDIAYTTGRKKAFKSRDWELNRWMQFFQEMQKGMTRDDGRMIPMLPVIGNHDVHQKKTKDEEMFYEVFPFPEEGKAYRNIVFGDYLDLVLLDTGHTSPIDGDQTAWLEKTLEQVAFPFVFAVYHVGAYPSYYAYNGQAAQKVRKFWVPLFEKARISGAFEHHSHAFKKTYPIKEGKVDPEGVIYFGDGSWGVPPREVYQAWYLEIAESVNACWFVHLTNKEARLEARTETGEIKASVKIGRRL